MLGARRSKPRSALERATPEKRAAALRFAAFILDVYLADEEPDHRQREELKWEPPSSTAGFPPRSKPRT